MEKCAKITAFPSREIQSCFAESTLTMCNFVFKHADLFCYPRCMLSFVLWSQAMLSKNAVKQIQQVTLYHCNANPLVPPIFFCTPFGRHPIHASCADFLVAFFLHVQKSFGSYEKWKRHRQRVISRVIIFVECSQLSNSHFKKMLFSSSRGTPCDKNNTHNVA